MFFYRFEQFVNEMPFHLLLNIFLNLDKFICGFNKNNIETIKLF